MTRNDYERIARALNASRTVEGSVMSENLQLSWNRAIDHAVEQVAHELAKDNLRFDAARFALAAGVSTARDTFIVGNTMGDLEPAAAISRRLRRMSTNDVFDITFDAQGVMDTIKRNGTTISAAHRDARVLLNNSAHILAGFAPKGFSSF